MAEGKTAVNPLLNHQRYRSRELSHHYETQPYDMDKCISLLNKYLQF